VAVRQQTLKLATGATERHRLFLERLLLMPAVAAVAVSLVELPALVAAAMDHKVTLPETLGPLTQAAVVVVLMTKAHRVRQVVLGVLELLLLPTPTRLLRQHLLAVD
jgi:hypothetical protein